MTEPNRHPFIVWEGDRGGNADGQAYRWRWQAVIAAWWARRYSAHDVWIERQMPRLRWSGDGDEAQR